MSKIFMLTHKQIGAQLRSGRPPVWRVCLRTKRAKCFVRASWASDLTKMIKAYHAPISDAEADAIVDYLAKIY